jgi:hypothetical protein
MRIDDDDWMHRGGKGLHGGSKKNGALTASYQFHDRPYGQAVLKEMEPRTHIAAGGTERPDPFGCPGFIMDQAPTLAHRPAPTVNLPTVGFSPAGKVQSCGR